MLDKYASSLGCHLLNRVNHAGKCIMDGPVPKNFRMPLVILAPSGYCKSTFQQLLAHKDGLLNSPTMHCNIEGTFTPESWVGTKTDRDDSDTDPAAVFAYYANGIAAVDEFERLIWLMDGDGSATEEVYMLQGLDRPDVHKRHSLGAITHQDICTTIWAALRPPLMPMRMTSGLARRFMFGLYLPGPAEWDSLKECMREGCAIPPALPYSEYRSRIQTEIHHILNTMADNIPTRFDFGAVNEWCDKHDQPSFVEGILQRIACGMSVVSGEFPDIVVSPDVEELFKDEIITRRMLKMDAPAFAVQNTVRGFAKRDGVTVKHTLDGREYPAATDACVTRFLMDYYQYSKVQCQGAIQAGLALRLLQRNGEYLLALDSDMGVA